MSDLILHHYAMSPFSEKIRAMLGYTQLPWQSVITREMPPRPHLDEVLVGGYRKIPVAQSGADLFCDSRIISSEIAALSNQPALAMENGSDALQQFVQRTDLEVFFACVMSANSKAMARKARASLSWLDLGKLVWDRINMGRKASVKMAGPKQAGPIVTAHLQQLESMLSGNDWLFGSTPTIADFSAYHGLWFIRDLAERSLISHYPRVNAWMDRIKSYGEGQRRDISIADAVSIARAAQPRPIAAADQNDPQINRPVSIAPSDYGQTPTRGVLVGANANRWIIAREHADVGTVHVHLPKQGMKLTVL